MKRNRVLYAIAIALVMMAGLLSRKSRAYLPDVINTYLGDALWAVMIYLLFCVLFPKWKPLQIGIASVLFCYLIEISQLYHAPWIDHIRHTTLGGLVLGFGFLWSDIVAYYLGVTAALLSEALWFGTQGRRPRT